MPKLTLADKEVSLKKWRGIKADLPNVKLFSMGGQPSTEVYGECGFCELYDFDCSLCPLYPNFCAGDREKFPQALYWRICIKLEKGEDASEDIDRMIAAIEAVEV